MSHLSEREAFAKTVYGESRGEPLEGQEAVAWVIKNRAAKNRDYWGGDNIKDVCLKTNQFECWDKKSDITIDDPGKYNEIRQLCDRVYDAPRSQDPTGGCDHFNNPDKEGYPDWTNNVDKVKKIGGHQFYKGN